MPDARYLDILPVAALHRRLGLSERVDYAAASLNTPFSKWRMDVDDAPILRSLYRQVRPARHLELGGACGVRCCLEECDAHVWMIHPPEEGFSERVTRIDADTREWNASEFESGFFDSALVSGDSEELVVNDTRKALDVVKPGGLMLWHGFCPDPSVFDQMSSVVNVVSGLTREWPEVVANLRDVFWVQPSFLLVGVRR